MTYLLPAIKTEKQYTEVFIAGMKVMPHSCCQSSCLGWGTRDGSLIRLPTTQALNLDRGLQPCLVAAKKRHLARCLEL